MEQWLQQLERLSVLADFPSEDGEREALLWQVTKDFFETCESRDRDEAALFGEVMEELAYSLELQVREELARKIAAEERAPHNLVVRLANDQIEVSKPVLQQSPVLTEDDLVKISNTRSQSHLLAVAQRIEVGRRLSAVLATRGNDDVLVRLAANPKAKLSPDTIGLITARSENCEDIRAALVGRQDVPRSVLLDLVEQVSESVRQDIRDKLGKIDEEHLDEAIASLKLKIEAGGKSRARRRIDELEKRQALSENAILGFLANNEPAEFLLGLARLFDIDLKTALRIVGDRSGRNLALACRAHKFSTEGFKQIAISQITATPSEPSSVLPLVTMYGRIDEESARNAMQFVARQTVAPHGAGSAAPV